MRRIILVGMIVFGLAVIFFTFAKHAQHHLLLKTYFRDAHGLRAGAPVRVAGVDVGRVTEVRVRPELKEHAAEVSMFLQTPYELKIPEDAVVSTATAGVLGETYAEIDLRGSSGAPAEEGGTLTSRESGPEASLESLVEQVIKSARPTSCDPPSPENRRRLEPH
ncbi:MAG: MlaD family protein [Acidobacteriia bacterium]|nr:MlaD family protein [Terriglobia bacterium]